MAFSKQEEVILRRIASENEIPEDFFLGVVHKESAGVAMYDGMPAIRIEGHYFYKQLPAGPQRDRAVYSGYAAKKAGVIKNPKTMRARYTRLDAMARINRHAAYESISIGIGQIMGVHYERLGYTSAVDMWKYACKGIVQQAEQMAKFIATDDDLLRAAQKYQYPEFSRIYNGPAYKKNNYDVELKLAVSRFARKTVEAPVVSASIEEVMTPTYVERIIALGFPTVRDFQQFREIKVDGIVGKITREEVDAMEAEIAAKKAKGIRDAAAIGAGGAVVGGGAIVAEDAVNDIEKYNPIINAVSGLAQNGTYVALGLGVVILGTIAGIIIYRKFFKR